MHINKRDADNNFLGISGFFLCISQTEIKLHQTYSIQILPGFCLFWEARQPNTPTLENIRIYEKSVKVRVFCLS